MIDMLSSSNASVTCDDADRDQFLQHILPNRLFKKSPRLKAFLIYICERSFAKRFDEISELQIAVHVFERIEEALQLAQHRTGSAWCVPRSCLEPIYKKGPRA
jgi:hypothetical protein